jgi:hypothetical protein
MSYWNGRYYQDKTCEMCGNSFQASRWDAKFCGQNCRKKFSRRKEQIRRAASSAIAEIRFIQSMMRQHEDLQIVGGLEIEKILSEARNVTPDRASHLAGQANVTLATVTDNDPVL